MRTKLILCAALAAAIAGCNQKAPEKVADHGPKLETDEQKVSYGIGLVEGKRFKQDFNPMPRLERAKKADRESTRLSLSGLNNLETSRVDAVGNHMNALVRAPQVAGVLCHAF